MAALLTAALLGLLSPLPGRLGSRMTRIAVRMQVSDEGYVTTASGLKYLDVKVGTGKILEKGDMVKVDYTGTLTDGKEFDTSKGRNPIIFELGAGRVIPG